MEAPEHGSGAKDHMSSHRSQRADTAFLMANLLTVLFGIGAVASLASISLGCSSLIAVIFFLVFVGLAGDAWGGERKVHNTTQN